MADAGEIGLPRPALRPCLLALSDTADVGIVQSAPRAADPTDDLDGRHRIAKAEDLLMCGVEILDELLNVGVRTGIHPCVVARRFPIPDARSGASTRVVDARVNGPSATFDEKGFDPSASARRALLFASFLSNALVAV